MPNDWVMNGSSLLTHPHTKEAPQMSLGIWFAALFALGLAAFGLCFWFIEACEKI
jgi:hypothetical protein